MPAQPSIIIDGPGEYVGESDADNLTIWRRVETLTLSMMWWARALGTALTYFALAQISLFVAVPDGWASAVWPAAGVAVVTVRHWGWPATLGVLVGACAGLIVDGGFSIATGLALAIGPALEANVAAIALRRWFSADEALASGRDVIVFLALAGPLACIVGSSWAAAVLEITGHVSKSALPFMWFNWWLGDTIGVVLAAPIVLCFIAEPRPAWRPRRLSVAVPLMVATAGVVLAFSTAQEAEADKNHAELMARGAVVAHAFEQRIDAYADLAAASASFVAATRNLNEQEFVRYATGAFGRDKEVLAVSWCPRVTREDRDAFVANARAHNPAFELRVMSENGVVPAPDRDELFPVLYIDPARPYYGLDISSEPSRGAAIAATRETHMPAASSPVDLLQGTRGMLVFGPVEGETMRGVIGVGVSTPGLIANATKRLATSDLWITVADVTDGTPRPLSFFPLEASEWTQTISLAGRLWRIGVARIAPPPRGWQVWFVLVGGLAVVGVLGTVLLTITGGRARLTAAEARYRDLYENAPDMYMTLAVDGTIRECNAAVLGVLGYAPDELVGKNLSEIAAPDSRPVLTTALSDVPKLGTIPATHIALRGTHARDVDLSVSATAIRDGNQVVAVRALLRDVSDMLEVERDHRFQIELGELLQSTDAEQDMMGQAAQRIQAYLGIERCYYAEVEAPWQQVLTHLYVRGVRQSDEVAPISTYENVGLGPLLRGSRFVTEDIATDERLAPFYRDRYAHRGLRAFVAVPLMRDGKCVAYFGVAAETPHEWTPREISLVQSVAERAWLWNEHLRSVRDLRQLSQYLEKRIEERTHDLVQALGDKDALIKEVHHRVKNNLQVISSMLNLQSRALKDAKLSDAFAVSQQRIQTIALVHERLYQSRDFSSVPVGDYLRSLVENIMFTYNAADRGISAEVEIAEMNMPIARAIPCGLIVNELISNAMKHAFPDARRGVISVTMTTGDKQIELTVADDGVGLPPGLDPARTDSLGLDLVFAFSEQLDAKLDISSERGAKFRLRFPAA